MITNEIVYMLGYITKKQWASALGMKKTVLSKEIFREMIRKVEKAYHVEIMSDVERLVKEAEESKDKRKRMWGE